MNRYYFSIFLIVSLYSAMSSAQYHASANAPQCPQNPDFKHALGRVYSSPQPAGGPGTPTVSHHTVNGTCKVSDARKAQMAVQAQHQHHNNNGNLGHSSSTAASSSTVSAATSGHPLTPRPAKASAAKFEADHAHRVQVVRSETQNKKNKQQRLAKLEQDMSNVQQELSSVKTMMEGMQTTLKSSLDQMMKAIASIAAHHSPHPSPLPSPAVHVHRASAHAHHSHAAAPMHPHNPHNANPAHAVLLNIPAPIKTVATPGGTPDLPTHPATPITNSGLISGSGSSSASPRSTATNATRAPLATQATTAFLNYSINESTGSASGSGMVGTVGHKPNPRPQPARRKSTTPQPRLPLSPADHAAAIAATAQSLGERPPQGTVTYETLSLPCQAPSTVSANYEIASAPATPATSTLSPIAQSPNTVLHGKPTSISTVTHAAAAASSASFSYAGSAGATTSSTATPHGSITQLNLQRKQSHDNHGQKSSLGANHAPSGMSASMPNLTQPLDSAQVTISTGSTDSRDTSPVPWRPAGSPTQAQMHHSESTTTL
jgi:hypothetical protein